ncbi:DUF2206 domain-containing protein [Halomarina litorea]|uniref:DUF2206 domain-containing protein n=1 Tax=Halomarina litorea TaxID=2961595 RepID=UPI0020C4935C|nr:DUF2206 domain-containing protein [Halomarina sp. BCD28]
MTNPQFQIRLRRRDFVAVAFALQALVLLVVGLGALGVSVPLFRPLLAVVYLTFVPGTLVVFHLGADGRRAGTTVLYAVGTSLVVALIVGALVSLLYPLVGIPRPLTPVPLALTFAVVVTGLGLPLLRDERTAVSVPRDWFSPVPFTVALLPLASVYGTALLEFAGNNWLLLGVLVAVSLFPVLVVLGGLDERWHALAMWAAALALIYHGGAIFGPFVGGHQSTMTTVAEGVWTPEISLLANGSLFAVFVVLADITTGIQWLVVNPFLMSFLPVILFTTTRRYLDSRDAFVAACVFMFAFPFYTLYTGAGRMGTPVFFLALVALAATDRDIPSVSASVLALLFAVGLTVSHYGTSYVAMFAFIGAACARLALVVFDRLRGDGRMPPVTLRGRPDRRTDGGRDTATSLLSASFIGFFIVAVLSWYVYTAEGKKFVSLVSHVDAQVQSVLYGAELSGSAAGAVQQDYGTLSITLAKNIYLGLGALMGLGLLVLVVNRLAYRARPVDDEFLALGAGFLSMIAASALPGGDGFNIARVMMITFVFTVPFAVFGVHAVADVVARGLRRVGLERRHLRRGLRTLGSTSLAAVLCVFLLLNAGVAAEVVTKDYGPSNKASTERLLDSEDPELRLRATECIECNVEAHVWLMSNADHDVKAYGDYLAWAQVDFYRGPLSERLGYVPSNGFYGSLWHARNGTDGPAYLLFLPHNVDTQGLASDGWHPLGEVGEMAESADRIYASGKATVYRTRGNATGPSG